MSVFNHLGAASNQTHMNVPVFFIRIYTLISLNKYVIHVKCATINDLSFYLYLQQMFMGSMLS